MLKIMIVDDEPLERRAIKLILETYRPEDQVVGEAGDGEEAVEVALKVCPDVILLDIRMPGLDGIEVARILRPALPETRVVVVTAYGEFNYAKRAVALGVSDYLLKPVDTQELVKLLDRLDNEVAVDRESREETERLRAALNDVIPLIRVGFVMDLINRNLTNEDEVKTRAKFLGMHQTPRIALHIWIDNLTGHNTYRSELEYQILQKQAGEAIQEALNDWPGSFAVPVGSGQFVVLLPADEETDDLELKESSQKLGDRICDLVRSKTNVTVSVGVGRPARSFGELARSHSESLTAGEFRLIYGGDQAIHADDVSTAHDSPSFFENGNEKGIAMAIRMGDWERTRKHLNSLWDNFSKGEINTADMRMKLMEISATSYRSALEGGVNPEEVTELQLPSDAELKGVKSYESIREQVLTWLAELVGRVRASREFRNANLVEKAVRFVVENYAQELSLEDVAKQVFLSPCYFSRLFKQVKGWSFSEYLTQIRMEEARRLLLNTDLQISEIAARVGYRDARYFSQVFKRNEGCTPVSFRREGV